MEKIAPFVAQANGPLREKLGLMMNIMRHWVVFIDPPRHARIRKILQRGFMPRAIQALELQVRATVI